MTVLKRVLSLTLVFAFLSLSAVLSAEPAEQPPGYLLKANYNPADRTMTAEIYVTDGRATVGQFGFLYDTDLFALCDTEGNRVSEIPDVTQGTTSAYLPNLVKGIPPVGTLAESNRTSDLVSLTGGYVYFAWYTPPMVQIDASQREEKIAEVRFDVRQGKDIKQFYGGMFEAAPPPQNDAVLGWKAGAWMANDLSQYADNHPDPKKRCEVRVAYTGFSFSGGTSDPIFIIPSQKRTVTFFAADSDGDPVAGAKVILDRETAVTSNDGIALCELYDGAYHYAVSKEGFYEYTGSVTLDGSDIRVRLTLERTEPGEFPAFPNAYITGYPDGSFSPEGTLTRAEAAALLARLSEAFDPDAEYRSDFPDVNPADWHADYIGFCAEQRIVNGYADGMFLPGRAVTRAEFSKLVCEASKLAQPRGRRFPDVEETHWAAGYINALADAEILGGYPDGSFYPEKTLTRAEAVKILNRARGRVPDEDQINAYYTEAPMPFFDLDFSHWAFYEVIEAAIPPGARHPINAAEQSAEHRA